MFFLVAVLTLGGSVPPGFWFLLAERFPGLFVSALEGVEALGLFFPSLSQKVDRKALKLQVHHKLK